jgi:hypothetical protein
MERHRPGFGVLHWGSTDSEDPRAGAPGFQAYSIQDRLAIIPVFSNSQSTRRVYHQLE